MRLFGNSVSNAAPSEDEREREAVRERQDELERRMHALGVRVEARRQDG